ncbi:hypothetical protein VXS06_14505 [Photobacterium toruni]|uniref:Baseplate protein n=1 Tax=Photobacterium toruni TaxID=1935446 RepID=A0ABU6L9Y7_9GAMM|nr:hypothetical protein [Photobacterium toruni]
MNNDLSRLSDLNIKDDILRADFYLIILRYMNSPDATGIAHTIALDEAQRQDLVSYRIYKTPDLRWLVGLICGVDDESAPLEVGETYLFPSSMFIRREMRAFLNDQGLN